MSWWDKLKPDKKNIDDETSSDIPPVNVDVDSSPKLQGDQGGPQQQTKPEALRELRLGSFDFESGDGYAYPSLFEEADDMVKLSNLIYVLADLRELARNGSLKGHETSLKILELPLSMDAALSMISEEAELLKEFLSDGDHDAALSAIQSLVSRQRTPQNGVEVRELQNSVEVSSVGWPKSWNNVLSGIPFFGETPREETTPKEETGISTIAGEQTGISTIVAVGDAKCFEELVYVVGINPTQKRITVAFRGSATKADFLTDANIEMVKVADPRKFAETKDDVSIGGRYSRDESTDGVCIHRGFYEYLFGENGGKSKYAEIMGHVDRLFDANPDRRNNHKLYITGHSLGGALATLFGFYASAYLLPLPVTVVSVASPRVGDVTFARTFTELESQGRIRHLRIANHMDPVTLGPTVSSKRAFTLATLAFSPLGYLALKVSGNETGDEERYFHTGMKMKLRKEAQGGKPRCELSYSGAPHLPSGTLLQASEREEEKEHEEVSQKNSSFWNKSVSNMPMVSYHFGTAYSERLALVESDLVGLTLNALYEDKAGKKSGKTGTLS